MTVDRYGRWRARAEAARRGCERRGGEVFEAIVEPPATEAEIAAVESALGARLPASLRRALAGFSRHVDLSWQLPDDAEPPVDEVFCGGLAWNLASLPRLEERRRSWVRECFPDANDPYGRVWQRTLPVMRVPNGDLVAIDLEPAGQPLVYLSHEGGEPHGWRLGADFADAIDRWSEVAFAGPEGWQWAPFVRDPTVGIDPSLDAARQWRAWLGVVD